MTIKNSIETEKPERLSQMETVLEVLNEGVLIVRDGDRILFANSRFVEMTGIPRQDLIGFDPSHFYFSKEWGDIDFANSPVVRQSVLREIRESPASRVMVNLSQVRYIDSSSVASLVEGLKASRELGSRFILIGLTTSARQVLELSRLLKLFEVYEDEAQALAA